MSESTFRHSNARVPRLYKEAGKIVQKVREEGGSFKGLVYQSKHRSIKSLYALVAETLRHGSELDALLRQTQILVKEPRLDPWLARVLITELVWRERELSGPSVPLKIVQSYKSQLLSEEIGIPSQRLKPVSKATRPRFVRINTLKATEQEVLNYFRQEGWNILEKDQYDSTKNEEELYKNYLHRICSLSMDEFIRDIHIQNLLIFPGNMEFYNFEYYHDGSLLLQDKASCMSAHLLDAPPGSTVLDMCAAPGMKTTHVAAFLENKGNIYAIEKHQGRFESLCKVVEKAGATCVTPILGNALHFTANDFPNVEYIVVDPTCSGSGMTNRKEIFNDEEDVSKSRLEKLSSFQCAILRHAMTNFPKTKRIVYSTCSLYPEENEAVVEEVLKTCPPNFKPVIPSKGTQWMKNGSSSYVYGEYGLYAKPNIDLTNGFFVIVFERTMNEYVSSKIITQDESTGINEVLDKKKKKREKRLQTQSRSNLFTETCTNPALEKMKKAMGNFYLLAQNEFVAPMESKKIIGEKKNELPAEQETSEHLPVELKQKKKKKGKLEAMKGGTVLPLDRTLKDPKADNFPLSEVNTAKRKHNRSFNRKQGIVKEACGELYLNPLERKDSYCYEEEIGVVKKLPEDSSSKRKKRDKPTVDEGGDLVNLSNRSCEFFKSKKRKNDHPSSME